jgi:hypothetical protein
VQNLLGKYSNSTYTYTWQSTSSIQKDRIYAVNCEWELSFTDVDSFTGTLDDGGYIACGPCKVKILDVNKNEISSFGDYKVVYKYSSAQKKWYIFESASGGSWATAANGNNFGYLSSSYSGPITARLEVPIKVYNPTTETLPSVNMTKFTGHVNLSSPPTTIVGPDGIILVSGTNKLIMKPTS